MSWKDLVASFGFHQTVNDLEQPLLVLATVCYVACIVIAFASPGEVSDDVALGLYSTIQYNTENFYSAGILGVAKFKGASSQNPSNRKL